MAWVVDTSVVIDLITGDPIFEPSSTVCLQAHLADGLVICPVSFAEIGPSFGGDARAAAEFLEAAQISSLEPWLHQDTIMAHQLWHAHQLGRRQGYIRKRPVADILIAAFAARFQGLITRNAADFQSVLPHFKLVEP